MNHEKNTTMKKTFYIILKAAFVISTIGLIMDSDVKEASIFLRFFEFIMMTTTIFLLLAMVYYAMHFIKQKTRKTLES